MLLRFTRGPGGASYADRGGIGCTRPQGWGENFAVSRLSAMCSAKDLGVQTTAGRDADQANLRQHPHYTCWGGWTLGGCMMEHSALEARPWECERARVEKLRTKQISVNTLGTLGNWASAVGANAPSSFEADLHLHCCTLLAKVALHKTQG